jgi:hypothetical protein
MSKDVIGKEREKEAYLMDLSKLSFTFVIAFLSGNLFSTFSEFALIFLFT